MKTATTRATCILLMCWTFLSVLTASAQPTTGDAHTPTPTYWKQHQFFIPYQAQKSKKLVRPIAKVQLLISRTGLNDWATLQSAEPNVQGFSYRAPDDGEYWFALRHLDKKGQPWPSTAVSPQMRMVIDTQQPELSLEPLLDANGETVIRYEARDANLQPDTLLLEIRSANSNWTALSVGEPDIYQPDRLVGRVRWQPPIEAQDVEVRGAIVDRAGHRANTTAQLCIPSTKPLIQGPVLTTAKTQTRHQYARQPVQSSGGPTTVTNPFTTVGARTGSQPPSHNWPASNRLTTHPQAPSHSPPASNPYSVASQTGSQPTRSLPIGERGTGGSQTGFNSFPITPLNNQRAPQLMANATLPPMRSSNVGSDSLWSSSSNSADRASRVVNSKTFDIEYDLHSVGPWGVAKVELWGTADNGQTWRSFGVDPDNRSPIRVSVPGAGMYGFRILVDGANSAGTTPPQAGDEAELTIAVDLQPPTAELLSTQLGSGSQADRLLVRWSAQDTNLEARPIALFYSSYPNGPWSTIASGLENTGSYTWRIERQVPGRFYLRLEARDVAGNLATYQTSSPVTLARPQPRGRLKGVRTITDGN